MPFGKGRMFLNKHYSVYDKDSTNVANHDNLDAFYDVYDMVLPRFSNDRRTSMNDQNKKTTDKYSNKKDTNKAESVKTTDSNKKGTSEYR